MIKVARRGKKISIGRTLVDGFKHHNNHIFLETYKKNNNYIDPYLWETEDK